jgi:hypothetical protein
VSECTGLGPLEVALLRAVAALTETGLVPTAAVLDVLESREHFGATYATDALQDLGAPWRVHLRLFERGGNWGGPDDPMADARYTEVGLSEIGRLALSAERGQVGPVPIDLVNGSVYRGGRVPPLDPVRTVRLLRRSARGDALDPAALDDLVRLPTGGTVSGDLDALHDGRAARVQMSCRIGREDSPDGRLLVLTGTPHGVGLEELAARLTSRVSAALNPGRRYADYLPRDGAPHDAGRPPAVVTDVLEAPPVGDDRIVLLVAADADLDGAERWVRGIWPVTVEADWLVPGGLPASLQRWAERCHADRSGLEALGELVG